MDRVTLPGGVELSRIVYGMWRVGDDSDTSPAHIRAKIEACLTQGITTIDQADIYGEYTAEGLLGACLKESPGLRDKVEIVTKCDIVAPAGRYSDARVKHYDTSAAHISKSIDISLSEMAIEHIDLLLIHRPDPFMDHHETGRALDDAVASGKVRAVGVSNFRPWDWTLLQSAMQTPLATNQIEISLQHHVPFTDGDIAFLQERGLHPMAWSPLGGGALFQDGELRTTVSKVAMQNGVDEAAVAMAWLLAHPVGILPVMGTNRIDRIESFSDALKVKMDRETWFELYTAALGREVA
ncbi:MAG: aldo/keto reductase [Pseudomonadota bacterium]